MGGGNVTVDSKIKSRKTNWQRANVVRDFARPF